MVLWTGPEDLFDHEHKNYFCSSPMEWVAGGSFLRSELGVIKHGSVGRPLPFGNHGTNGSWQFFFSLIDGTDSSLSLIAQIDHNQLVESSAAISLVIDYIGGETNKKLHS
jgi:hypothetical protein